MVDHLPYLSWSHLLLQLLSSSDQILLRYIPFAFLIEVLENALDVVFGISFAGTIGHHLDELFECYFTAVVGVEYWHGDVDEWSAWLVSSEISDSFTDIHGGEHAVVVIVEKIEDLFENFDVSDWTLCDHVFFGIEIDIFFNSGARFLSPLFGSLSLVC